MTSASQNITSVKCALLSQGQYMHLSGRVRGYLGWLTHGRGQAAAERVHRLLRAGGEKRQPGELRQERPVLSVLCNERCMSMTYSVAHGSVAEHRARGIACTPIIIL